MLPAVAPRTIPRLAAAHVDWGVLAFALAAAVVNGVLFAMERDVPVGSIVDFTIMLPGEVVGARRDVQIDCRGRVVRSFDDRGRRGVGVVIDEYHFERA